MSKRMNDLQELIRWTYNTGSFRTREEVLRFMNLSPRERENLRTRWRKEDKEGLRPYHIDP